MIKLLRAYCFIFGHSWYSVISRINVTNPGRGYLHAPGPEEMQRIFNHTSDHGATAECVTACARCLSEERPTWDHDYWPPPDPHRGYTKAPTITFS